MSNKKMTTLSLISEMDQRVNQMLKLIEEDADSFAKKAEMYYQKRPELISLVEDFYRMYRSLAERYDHVTGELRRSIPQDLQSQGSGISEVGSEPPSTMPSPDRRPSRGKSGSRAVGFDVFLGSGGVNASDLDNKEGDESSTLDSESETDDSYSGSHSNDEEQGLRQKIIELEKELREIKEKLQTREEEISQCTCKNSNGENLLTGGVVSQDDPVVLDPNADKSLPEENEQLQADITRISEERTYLENNLKELDLRCQSLEEDMRRVTAGKAEMEAMFGSQIEQLNAEIADKNACMEELKKNLDALQLKYDMLVTEKDDNVSELAKEVSFKDDQIDQMSTHLHQLHMEHVNLIAGAERARKLAEALRSRIKQLEREVEKKQEIIVQGAEEKREAIRQLCFSLEHYRNGYHRLREVVTGQKPVAAT